MKPDTLRRLHRPLSHTVLMTALMALGWGHAPAVQATTGAATSKVAAVDVTREQAEAEVLTAQALALEHGEGVPRDEIKAAELYCEAARMGDVDAMFSLGWMYANGRGVPRNDEYAGALFVRAADKGNEYAKRMLTYTGGDRNAGPSCLEAPPPQFANTKWNVEARLARYPSSRREIAQMVVETAESYQISPEFALAIAGIESAFNPKALSPKNAMGVMQLIPATAARFNVKDAFDPRENIRGGMAYLRWLLAYFEGDIALAAAGYNAGEGAVERYRGVPPFKETQAYVARVLAMVEHSHHPYDRTIARPSRIMAGVQQNAAVASPIKTR